MANETQFLLGTLTGAALCFILACVRLHNLMHVGEHGDEFIFMKRCEKGTEAYQAYYTGCANWHEWWDSVMVVIFVFGALCLSEWAALSAVRAKSGASLAGLTFAAALASFLAYYLLAKPWATYQIGRGEKHNGKTKQYGATLEEEEWTIDVMLVFYGYSIMCATIPLTIAFARMFLNLSEPVPAEVSMGPTASEVELLPSLTSGTAPNGAMGDPMISKEVSASAAAEEGLAPPLPPPSPAKDLVMMNVGMAIPVLMFCFFVTTIGTPMWNFSMNSYFRSASKYSLGYWPLGEMPCSTEAYQRVLNPNWEKPMKGCPWTTVTEAHNKLAMGQTLVLSNGTTDADNKVLCYDGEYVTNWRCRCNATKQISGQRPHNVTKCIGAQHGQRLKCPPNMPKMCEHKTRNGTGDYRCEKDCSAYGGERKCVDRGDGKLFSEVPSAQDVEDGKAKMAFPVVVDISQSGGVPGSCRDWRKEEVQIAAGWGTTREPWKDAAPWFTFKVFTDNVYFYVYLAGALLVGAWAHHAKPKALQEIKDVSFIPKAMNAFPNGITLLELIALVSCGFMFFVWLWYWMDWFELGYGRFEELDAAHDCWDNSSKVIGSTAVLFNRTQAHCDHVQHYSDSLWANKVNGTKVPVVYSYHGFLHIICRVSGHMTSFAFALTMLPTSKASMLLRGIGLTYEAVMHWHRGLGMIAYVMCTLHMLLWWLKFLLDGTFWVNLIHIDTQNWLWITPSWNHYENYAVLMVQYAWFFFTAAMVIAMNFRREQYRLFYISHHLAVLFLFFGIMHAWSFWYFIMPGMGLWWCDRMARLVMASEPAKVTQFRALPGTDVTEVKVLKPAFAARFTPGQFALINMPEVSKNDWHPFTVNVSDGSVIFLIKEEKGWTKNLRKLALGFRQDSSVGEAFPEALVIGPYGGIHPNEYSQAPVFLAAGGIGVTPVLSVFQECMRRHVPGVTFLWSVRSVSYLDIPFVQQVLKEAGHPSCAKDVTVVVHVTQHKGALPTPPSANITYNTGRPKIPELMKNAIGDHDPAVGFSFGCGPAVLTDQVTKESKSLGFGKSHVEVFAF